ncbi:serine/threonine-protein kinase [Aeromicrobium wangtongii]|uniref:non-specific serine/threonine protein kinase n=1 Tax=Aeromicrobium wangtongii TaxID=2969247 RepID=A0ABY5M953_9ACTN|nr:serine/threonine-protein kinase [Aeromicrobium wangtongii]MCD9198294.1 serine/threonine protein kinase [Aeromicrobium wangtongii]UUP12326.1 serine/threonine protein kinase [Aeromicrobium wangtongii]
MAPDPLATTPIVPIGVPQTVPVEQRFELLGRIGAGNHGVVFRARDSQLQREVAIKRFSHFLADDPRAMRRITREVATLARVSHPHVVTVHDLVHMADGDGEITPHLVMELVEGTSLKDLLALRGPSLRSVIVVRGVLEGLAACHAADILHLDIKPANILVTQDGGIKIVDFGIARAASDATATVAGTPHYMAPEQFDGRADERSDIYSVGCLLYECLTGTPPFAGTMASQLLAHRSHPRPDPRAITPEVPAALADVVRKAMAIDPADRYQSVQEMRAALTGISTTPDIGAGPRPVAAAAPGVVRPLPVNEPVSEPATEAVAADDVVTRWTKLQTLAIGLALAAFVVALVPSLIWFTNDFVPYEYRPPAMQDSDAGAWWMLAVVLATTILLLRRRAFFSSLSGPPVGEPRAERLVDGEMRSGIRVAAGAALRGSLPMLFPAYVVLVAAVADTGGVAWPDDVFSGWGVCWLLMPLACVFLGVQSVTKLRLRFGAVLKSTTYAFGAAAAAALFVAYPLVQ